MMRTGTIAVVAAMAAMLTSARADAQPSVNCHTRKAATCAAEPARPLPTSLEELQALHEKIGGTPQGAAAAFIYAHMVRAVGDEALGDAMLLALVTPKLGARMRYYLRYLGRTDGKYWRCVKSYAVGSSPANNYQLDPKKVGLVYRRQDSYVGSIESGKYKLFACSSGMDSCSPMTLVLDKKTDLWKMDEASSFAAMGCRESESDDEDERRKDADAERRRKEERAAEGGGEGE